VLGFDRPQSEGMTNPTLLLRLEGLVALTAGIAAFVLLGGHWPTFALLFLVPDLSMLGYLAGPRAGAIAYNTAHTYLVAAAVATLGLAVGSHALLLGAAIAVAHVGFDRALGYGLKLATGFNHTHLGYTGATWRDPGKRSQRSRPTKVPSSSGAAARTSS